MLDILNESMSHLSAYEILDAAKTKMESISLSTVYRNLGILEEEGLVRKIHTDLGQELYDSNTKLHGHIICPNCNKVYDFYDFHLDKLKETYKDRFKGYDFNLKILCEDCAKSKGE